MINLNSLTKNIKDGFKAPTGDSNRETPTKGALRFNTETGKPEIYAKGRGWRRASVSEISAIYTHDNLVAFYDASNTDTTGDTSDQYYNDVSLLLHMNGTDGSTTFTDSSSGNRTVTGNGNAAISTDQFKFGGSSYEGDGSGDYLAVPYSADMYMDSGDFTWEGWIRLNDLGSNSFITYYKNTGNKYESVQFTFHHVGGLRYIRANNSGGNDVIIDSGLSGWSTDTWYHVAAVRSNNTITLYRDGVSLTSGTETANINPSSNNSVWLFSKPWSNGSDFDGYADEWRITKGVARYTADFTPQTREFYPGTGITDITSNSIDMVSRNPSNISLNLTEPKSYDFVKGTGGSQGVISSVNNSSLPLLSSDYTISAWVFINS